MPNKTIIPPSQEILLSPEDCQKDIPAFIKLATPDIGRGQFAKALASAFLKFTQEGKSLSEIDSVQSFIQLADLHRVLVEEAQRFLKEEIPFVYEDQPLQSLLVSFANFRLSQASRRYYFATLQNQPVTLLDELKLVVKQHQDEYDMLLQQI